MTKAEMYVVARLAGKGTRAAARHAGYARGVPSEGARKLWRWVVTLREDKGGLVRVMEREERRVAALRDEVRRLEGVLYLMRVARALGV